MSSEVDSLNKPVSTNRRLDIQGLRAVAVLMVVAFHAGLPVSGGFLGVDVFFVISGFVITAMLIRTWQTTGTIRFRQFYYRRFKRLTPALAMTVTFTVIAGAAILSPVEAQATAAWTGLGAMLFFANYVIHKTTGGYFDAPAETNPLTHTWSLSVEEQFYFLFPLLLFIGLTIARRKGFAFKFAPILIVSGVATVSFVAAAIFTAEPGESSRFLYGFYNPITRVWEFAFGALIVLLINTRTIERSKRFGLLSGIAGAALLLASLFLIDGTTRIPGPWTLLPVVGAMLLLIAGFAETNMVSRLLASSPMVKIGDWSYSIYLWHWPFIVFARLIWPDSSTALLIAAILSFAPAIISFYYLEQPIRKLPNLSAGKTAGLIGTVMLVPLLFVAGLGYAQSNQWWSTRIQEFHEASSKHAGNAKGCIHYTWEARKEEKCTWNKGAPGAPIYLVGDSNADHFSEAVIGSAEQLDRPFRGLTQDGCRFAQKNAEYKCDYRQSKILDYLLEAKPGTVVISNLTSNEKLLTERTRALQNAGHQTILVKPIPIWGEKSSWNPWTCSTLEMVSGNCNRSMTLDSIREEQGPEQDDVETAAKATNSYVIETWPLICPTGTCFIQSDGLIRFRDGTHISVQQSLELTGAFADAIRTAAK